MAKQRGKEPIEQRIVEDILCDLADRRGLSGAWDSIDDDIQAEIRNPSHERTRRP